MPAFTPRLQEIPAEFAVFPLPGALLLPGGRLPLNIFEPRYLAMVEDCLAHGRMFGMIQPDPSRLDGPNGPALYPIGCLGRLSSFSETEDGRFLITLTGLLRFRIVEEPPLATGGFRRIRADVAAFRGDLDDGRPAPLVDRAALLKALRAYFAAQRMDANWQAIEQTEDALLVTTLAMVCPFASLEKQALLEAVTEEDRARMLISLLEIGACGTPANQNDRPN